MKQLSLAATDFVKKPKQTKREKFLVEMELVVPWSRLLDVIDPVYPKAGNGRRPFFFVRKLVTATLFPRQK